MTDVYKVGIRVQMTNMVSSVLRVIVKDLKLADASAIGLKRTLNEIKLMGMIGVAAGVAGGAGLYAAKGAVEAATRYQTAYNKLAAMGVGDVMMAQADKFARGTDIIGASSTDLMNQVRDLTMVLGKDRFNLAQQIAPTMAQINFVNKSLFPDKYDDRQALALEKVIEMKGGWKSAADFRLQAEMMEKVFAGTGGAVTPSDYLAFAKTAGVAGRLLSNKAFYYEMEPMIQEMGGSRVGTALMSAYNNLGQGRSTVRAAREMMRLGLLDPKNVEYDKIGQVKTIHPGALKGFSTFTSDPGQWLMQTLVPALRAAGFTTKEQMMNEMGVIFGNRTGSALYSLMLVQWDKVLKNIATTAGAADIGKLMEIAQKSSPTAAWNAMSAAWERMSNEVGKAIMPIVVPALNALTEGIRDLGTAMYRHPLRTEYIVRGIGALSVSLVGLAAAMPLAMVYKMAQFVGVTKMIGGVLSGTVRAGANLLPVLAGLCTPMTALAAAIAAVGAAIYYTTPSLKTWKEAGAEAVDLAHLLDAKLAPYVNAVKHPFDTYRNGLSVGPPPPQQPIFKVENNFDRRGIATMVTQEQAKAGNRPSSGYSGFDPRQSYTPAGAQ